MVTRNSKRLRKNWQDKIITRISRMAVGRKRNRRLGSWFSLLPLVVTLGALWWLIRQSREQTALQEKSDDWRRYRAPYESRSDIVGQVQEERGRSGYTQRSPSEPPSKAMTQTEKTQTQPSEEDDLVQIEGIGPKTARVLRDAGIYTFVQLAEIDMEQLKEILRNAELRGADPSTWPEQARLAARGDWEGLASLRDVLQGGRRVD